MQQILTPESEMPFGSHRGKKLKNVPNSYWMWLSKQQKSRATDKRVLEYMISNDLPKEEKINP